MATPYATIGQPVGRAEGPEKVSGTALYPADISLPGILVGKCLRSPYPYARIKSIDATAARRVPGVHAVLTGFDIPDLLVGRMLRDIPILARDVVRFVGQKVAAVAAEDADSAEEALSLIEVDYEELTPVLDPIAAMQPDAPTLHPNFMSYSGRAERPGNTPMSSITTSGKRGMWRKALPKPITCSSIRSAPSISIRPTSSRTLRWSISMKKAGCRFG